MEEIKEQFLIIYNSSAGRGKSYDLSKKIAYELEKIGKENIVLFSNNKKENLHNHFLFLDKKPEGVIISVGGDGTLGTVVNAICKNDIDMKLAVYPCGTANDFASSIKVSRNIKKFVQMIISKEPVNCDVAKVNDCYAINAIGSGNFSHAGEVFNPALKRKFGKFGYYIKCFFAAFNMKSNLLKISSNGQTLQDDFLFYYVVNSHVAGGFKHFSPKGKLDDGTYAFVGVRKCTFLSFCFLFLRILFGTHIKSKHICYIQSDNFLIESMGENSKFVKSDLDGNIGPNHPLKIKIINKKLKIFTKIQGDKI